MNAAAPARPGDEDRGCDPAPCCPRRGRPEAAVLAGWPATPAAGDPAPAAGSRRPDPPRPGPAAPTWGPWCRRAGGRTSARFAGPAPGPRAPWTPATGWPG